MTDKGLYIHIPFCVKKCSYCDFNSVALKKGDDKFITRMINALTDELKMYTDYQIAKNTDSFFLKPYDTVFIGGGTPSILPVKEMDKLLSAILSHVSITNSTISEFTIECNPGTLDNKKLSLYKNYGINRLSMGLQSADDKELRMLGRIHTYDDFLKSYELVKSHGFDNINIDIMSAIPTQSLKSYEKTLQKVTSLKPYHISAYSLIIEPYTPFYDMYKDAAPVDEKTDALMYDMTKDILSDVGYVRYEVSNYSRFKDDVKCDENHMIFPERSTYACRHNLNYWRRGGYIGIGPGASSYFPDTSTRRTNTTDLKKYIEQIESGHPPVLEEEILTTKQSFIEEVYLGLRTIEGIDIASIKNRYVKDTHCQTILSTWPDKLQRFANSDHLCYNGNRYALTPRGMTVSDSIISAFIDES